MDVTVSLRFTNGGWGSPLEVPPPLGFFFSTGLFPLLGRFLWLLPPPPPFLDAPPLSWETLFADTSCVAPRDWYREESELVSTTTGLGAPLIGLPLCPEPSSLWVPQELVLSLSYWINKLRAPMAWPGVFFLSFRLRFFAGGSEVCFADWLGFSEAWQLARRNYY